MCGGKRSLLKTITVSLVIFLAVLLFLSGCSGKNEPANQNDNNNNNSQIENNANNEEPVAEGPRRGGEVHFYYDQDPTTFLVGTLSQPGGGIGTYFYPGLIRLDLDRNPHPYAAKSWDISEDSRRITFYLRDDIKFTDGVPLTSADVKWTFEEISAKHSAQMTPVFKQVTSIETPDDYTIVLNFDQPYGPLFVLLCAPYFGIHPKHRLEGKDLLTDPDAMLDAVGWGPFKLAEWKSGEYIILERNEDYFEEGKPYLDRIIFRMITDTTAQLYAFENQEIDSMGATGAGGILEHIPRLRELPFVGYREGLADPAGMDLFFNLKNDKLSKFEVRAAICHAIDRELINDMVWMGLGIPAISHFSPEFGNFYNPKVNLLQKYEYNPAKAEEMLDAAGYPRGSDGTRFELRLITSNTNQYLKNAQEVIIDQLRAVGIKVIPENFDVTGITQRVYESHDFDMKVWHCTQGADPIIGVERWCLSDYYGSGRFAQNPTGYANERVDELFWIAKTSAVPEERISAFHEIQEILAEEMPYLPLNNPPSIGLYNNRMQDYGFYLNHFMQDVWVKE
ncbi:MAG: hypothetical protein GX167_05905 [Firmicutes bacterium]|nr:hypothetical protein [Bacillota bacterium]